MHLSNLINGVYYFLLGVTLLFVQLGILVFYYSTMTTLVLFIFSITLMVGFIGIVYFTVYLTRLYINTCCAPLIAIFESPLEENLFYSEYQCDSLYKLAKEIENESKKRIHKWILEGTYADRILFLLYQIKNALVKFEINPPLETYQLVDINGKTCGHFVNYHTNVYKVEYLETETNLFRQFDYNKFFSIIIKHVTNRTINKNTKIALFPQCNKKPDLRLV